MDRSYSLNRTQSLSRGVLLLASGLTLVFGASVAFAGDSAVQEEAVLASTFGAGMGLFGLALTVIAFSGDRRAWLGLWYFPVFFAIHVAAFGTWVPDAPLLVLTAGALWASRPASLAAHPARSG